MVMRHVRGVVGRQRAQAHGRQQSRFDSIDHPARARAGELRKGEASHRQDLIGTEGRVDRAGVVVDVDEVVEMAVHFVPEALLERS